MADSSDVCNVLVNTVSQTLFSTTYVQGSIANSTLGYLCQVSRGYPLPADLDANLGNSITTVSIIPLPGLTRDTTRYNVNQTVVSTSPITLYANTSNKTLTLGGTPSTSQVVGIQSGNVIYAYRPNATDNTISICTALAGAIPGANAVTNTINLPSSIFNVSIVADQFVRTETRRQQAVFSVCVWTYDPTVRDRISSTIDAQIAAVRAFVLPDGSQSDTPRNAGSYESDYSERADLWRRDMRYTIEYPTTLTTTYPTVIFPDFSITTAVLGQTGNGTVWTNVLHYVEAVLGSFVLGNSVLGYLS